jgi:tRNA A22 N-methylase
LTGHVPRIGRRSSPRVDALLGRVQPRLPIWDLCCDGGQIGCVAMDRDPTASVVFVDRRPGIVEALTPQVARWPRYAGRYRILCADVLRMTLPPTPVNFIIAGVGTNLVWAFADRLVDRVGDVVICATSQCPERFEALGAGRDFVVRDRLEVRSRYGRQTMWTLRRGEDGIPAA